VRHRILGYKVEIISPALPRRWCVYKSFRQHFRGDSLLIHFLLTPSFIRRITKFFPVCTSIAKLKRHSCKWWRPFFPINIKVAKCLTCKLAGLCGWGWQQTFDDRLEKREPGEGNLATLLDNLSWAIYPRLNTTFSRLNLETARINIKATTAPVLIPCVMSNCRQT